MARRRRGPPARPVPVWDRLVAWRRFVQRHRRLPSRRLLLNDVLYRMKVDGTLSDPLRVETTDKDLAKAYLARFVPVQHIVPTLAILRTPAEIDAYDFPRPCFVKPTHASGEMQRIAEGAPPDRARLKRWLGLDYHRRSREANYRSLEPKLIVEPPAFAEASLREYRLYVWQGRCGLYYERTMPRQRTDMTYHIPGGGRFAYDNRFPLAPEDQPPACAPALIDAAERIGAALGFVRVDAYSDGTDFRIGELTHCEASASGLYGCRRRPHLVSEAQVSRLIFVGASG
jgi:hypothetical protein